MIVFKTFLKVLNKCKIPIIMYTVILIVFAGFNMQTSENTTNFVASKPDVLIVNNDKEIGITKNLIDYIKNNSEVKEIKDDNKIDDALFYRDVNYIIYIPENYREDFLNRKNPEIKVKSTGDYLATYEEMLLERYLKVSNIYVEYFDSEEQIIEQINNTLEKQAELELTSNLNTDSLSKATFYYNFASYSLLAGCVYVICLILSSFKEEKIRKRTIISSMEYKVYNRQLLFSNGLFAFVLWLFYVILSFILLGSTMFTAHGIIYIINSFIFAICTLTIAFLIGNTIKNKNAINGIVNVVALRVKFLMWCICSNGIFT